jgi:hypothetical protein
MLSLTPQRHWVGQQESASQPVTSSSSRGARLVPAAGAAAAAAGVSGDEGVSNIGAAYNRTLLLELVQQDDVSAWGWFDPLFAVLRKWGARIMHYCVGQGMITCHCIMHERVSL